MSAANTTPRPYGVTSLHANVIGKSNQVGLARDLTLLQGVLEGLGLRVSLTLIDREQAARRRSPWTQLGAHYRRFRRQHVSQRVDVNVMLEHVWPQYLHDAAINIVVPNPEWFDRHDQRLLRYVDHVWAKTRYTEQLFQSLGGLTTLIGFDSYDRYDGAVAKRRQYFHLAGKSSMKGTERLLDVWCQHPEWPQLTVVQHKPPTHQIHAANIRLMAGYLSVAELRELQNQSLFHLCLSRTEGWGHYIVEALSTAAVTLTVDAMPMNELVTDERGILVPYSEVGTQRLAQTYEFHPAALERAIEETLTMSDEQCASIGAQARSWFLHNKDSFPDRVRAAIAGLATTQN